MTWQVTVKIMKKKKKIQISEKEDTNAKAGIGLLFPMNRQKMSFMDIWRKLRQKQESHVGGPGLDYLPCRWRHPYNCPAGDCSVSLALFKGQLPETYQLSSADDEGLGLREALQNKTNRRESHWLLFKEVDYLKQSFNSWHSGTRL